ncbi:flavin-binding monooxygenase family protein [Actinidia rufa]|uniref:Flavin-containing monooxygenase n=1 Tax=Actinidia rufa TaxID=165716 RepID=A0A7J0FXW7_9ERIC|nr:flavin-binding monooxygenase family protein [Actinidia rufa]
MASKGNLSKQVCVIGAGPSGLVAARELRKEGHSVVWFEGHYSKGPYSIYASLRLLVPREVMGFTDFPFLVKKGRDMRRFPGHEEMFLYLKDFCEWFGLGEMIRFNARVEYVGMLENDGLDCEELRWVVRSREKCEKVVEEVFDAVVVATGHYSQPRLPTIKGMDAWKRKQIHSHIYRVPDSFHNEVVVVVVVGSFVSGRDISMELLKMAKEIHLSAKSLDDLYEGLPKFISKHDNMHLHPQIDSLQEDGRVSFVDGSWVTADTIIYCTGYSYSFPFLDTKGIVVVDDDRVGPLYEHTFPPLLAPSLSFVGIPKRILGFPFFESQGKWIAHLLSGKRTLPTCDDMMQSIKEFYHSREIAGFPKHKTHEIGTFEYSNEYGDHVGFPHLEEWRIELSKSSLVNFFTNMDTYRDSYDHDLELLQVAYQSPHFTQLGLPDAFT